MVNVNIEDQGLACAWAVSTRTRHGRPWIAVWYTAGDRTIDERVIFYNHVEALYNHLLFVRRAIHEQI